MDVKERIVAELVAARDRSFGLTVASLSLWRTTAGVTPNRAAISSAFMPWSR